MVAELLQYLQRFNEDLTEDFILCEHAAAVVRLHKKCALPTIPLFQQDDCAHIFSLPRDDSGKIGTLYSVRAETDMWPQLVWHSERGLECAERGHTWHETLHLGFSWGGKSVSIFESGGHNNL